MPRRSTVSEAMEEGLYEEHAEENENASPKKGFDFNKYKINLATEVKTLVVEGNAFDVTVKPLSWSKKNQFMSKCLKWDSDGSTVFDGDAYVRLSLQEIIVSAPWGKTSELFLISIDDRLGNVLETLVPQAFGSDVGGEVDNLKDES